MKVGCFVGFLPLPEENLTIEKITRVGLLTHVNKETGSKAGCLACFLHHCVTTTSVHMCAYRYPLFESRPNTGS